MDLNMDDEKSKMEQGALSGLIVAVLIALPLMAATMAFTGDQTYRSATIAWLVIGIGIFFLWRRKRKG